MLAEFGAGRVDMRTRGGHDCAAWFPEVAEALARYKGGPFIVDAEVCVMDKIGRIDFRWMQDRAVRRCYYPDCDPVPMPCSTCSWTGARTSWACR